MGSEMCIRDSVLTGNENGKKESLNKALRNKVCLDSNVLSKESAKLLVTEEEIENDKDKSFLDERFRNSFGKYFGSRQVHFVEKSKKCNQYWHLKESYRAKRILQVKKPGADEMNSSNLLFFFKLSLVKFA